MTGDRRKANRRPLWREPLVHFIAAGALIFALDAWRGGADGSADRIVVPVAQVERLALVWERTWGRPPTDDELQGVVRDYIKDEIYAREAVKLGLDVDDTVIRRRLRQKMEFFVLAEAEARVPAHEELAAFHASHRERYVAPATYSFDQVYFLPGNAAAATAAKAALARGAGAGAPGDRIALPRGMSEAPVPEIARVFGADFAGALDGLPVGDWHGPIQSGRGLHLVRVTASTPARPLTLDQARAAVERDWRADMRTRAEAEAYDALRAGYEIVIETPVP